jgi:hypothetical protein
MNTQILKPIILRTINTHYPEGRRHINRWTSDEELTNLSAFYISAGANSIYSNGELEALCYKAIIRHTILFTNLTVTVIYLYNKLLTN